MYVHFDGYPDSKLPLLLTAYQHRFAGDLEAMARHLIDDVEHGWDELGTDLLDGAPEALRRTRQAVHDLRRHGYEVHADYSLDPGRSASPPRPAVRKGLVERRNRIAQAASTRSPQQRGAPTTTLPEYLPQPGAVPIGSQAQRAAKGRSR